MHVLTEAAMLVCWVRERAGKRQCLRAWGQVLSLSMAIAALSGCREAAGRESRYTIAGADPERGKADIRMYGCGSCHMIPGLRDANGTVGPPLIMWSRRTYIAGEVPNTPEFLVRWIEMPQAIEPGTAMPNLGVTEGRARDIAAYLYTIK